MTFSEFDMYPYIMRSLRERFPKYEGWNIFQQDNWETYIPDFVIERRNRRRVIERVVVEAKLVDRVQDSHVSQLNSYVRNLSGPNVRIKEKILALPSGVDLTLLPDDVSTIILRKFKCRDGFIYYDE